MCSPPTFDALLTRHPWTPIPGCPGRLVLKGAAARPDLTPVALLGADVAVEEHHVAATPDAVLVVAFPGGGLLTFRKADGTHIHTLNTPEGLARRLRKLGLEPPAGLRAIGQAPHEPGDARPEARDLTPPLHQRPPGV